MVGGESFQVYGTTSPLTMALEYQVATEPFQISHSAGDYLHSVAFWPPSHLINYASRLRKFSENIASRVAQTEKGCPAQFEFAAFSHVEVCANFLKVLNQIG